MYAGKRIDAHTHCVFDSDWDRIFAFFDARNIVKLNCICGRVQWSAARVSVYKTMYKRFPDRFTWGTYIPLPDFTVGNTEYAKGVIEYLKRDFDDGATSCKVHNEIGMILKKPDGSSIMIDDPLFDPIFDFVATAGKVLILHMAEPFPRWPEWPDEDPQLAGKKIYGPLSDQKIFEKMDFPGYFQQIEAMENAIRKHPNLKVVAAHLAALGHDVRKLGELLDRCPNLAVDSSGRRRDLAVEGAETVREFFVKYQDRILWGMDQYNDKIMSEMSEPEKADFYHMMGDGYDFEFGLYESNERVQVDKLRAQGLNLPEDVLEKFYSLNAKKWFGI